VHNVVMEIRNAGGRFLKKDRTSGNWTVLSESQSKEKVGHALRDAVAGLQNKKKKRRKKGTPSEIGGREGAIRAEKVAGAKPPPTLFPGEGKHDELLAAKSKTGKFDRDFKGLSLSSTSTSFLHAAAAPTAAGTRSGISDRPLSIPSAAAAAAASITATSGLPPTLPTSSFLHNIQQEHLLHRELVSSSTSPQSISPSAAAAAASTAIIRSPHNLSMLQLGGGVMPALPGLPGLVASPASRSEVHRHQRMSPPQPSGYGALPAGDSAMSSAVGGGAARREGLAHAEQHPSSPAHLQEQQQHELLRRRQQQQQQHRNERPNHPDQHDHEFMAKIDTVLGPFANDAEDSMEGYQGEDNERTG